MSEDILSKKVQVGQLIEAGRDNIGFFSEYFLGITPHQGQIEWFDRSNSKINILVPGKRYGKTVSVAIKHIHKAFYKKGIPTGDQSLWVKAAYKTLNISPHSQQAEQCAKYMQQILTSSFTIRLPDGSARNNDCLIGDFLARVREAPYYTLDFSNGATFQSRSSGADMGESIEGQAYAYISYDEGAASNHLEEEINSVFLPRLIDMDGTLDIVSTPYRSSPSWGYYRDLFYAGTEGKTTKKKGVFAMGGSTYDNVYQSRESIEEIAETISISDPDLVKQAIYGEFVLGGDSFFAMEEIFEAASTKLDWQEPLDDHRYVMGVDTAVSEDYFVAYVIDVTNTEKFRVVAKYRTRGRKLAPSMHVYEIKKLARKYGCDKQNLIIDTSNESGAWYMEALQDIFPIPFRFGMVRGGINSKHEMLMKLKEILSDKRIKYPSKDRDLTEELTTYQIGYNEKGEQKDRRLKTDCVMALGLAVWLQETFDPTRAINAIDLEAMI